VSPSAAPALDPQTTVRVHFLDVGFAEYGDAVLCQLGATSVLIDGAHPGDQDGSPGHDSIPDQLAEKLGQQQPFTIDLLIVTHAHQDHIGCLPSLVEDDVVRPRFALVADPKLGWGRPLTDNAPPAPPDSPRNRLVAGLREEILRPDTDDETLEQFLSDALGLEQRYIRMLETLEQRGTTVVRYTGIDPPAPLAPNLQALVDEFDAVRLQILGPTKNQLVLCADAIANATDAAAATVDAMLRADATHDDAADAYRRLAAGGVDAIDAGDRPGPAVNLQSIVTSFERDGVKLLFAGDLQFADPQRPEQALHAEVDALRGRIADAAPFDLAKLSHHGSDNAFSSEILDDLGATPLLGICAGESSTAHPNPEVLELLDDERDRLKWVRTDRNRLSTISFTGGGDPSIDIAAGQVSDATPNTPDVEEERRPVVAETGTVVSERARTTSATVAEQVEVVTRLPHVATRIRVTIEVDPEGAEARPAVREPEQAADEQRIASGRALPPLLFATSRDALGASIGVAETEQLLERFEQDGLHVYAELPGSPLDVATAEALVRDELRLHPEVQGVVLVGGFDVIPSRRVDCLPEELRTQVGHTADPDDFIVWSDDGYGDLDGGLMPDLPVSRVPDGRSPGLLFAALAAASGSRAATRNGVINVARPFAAPIFRALSGQDAVLVSQPATFDQVPAFVLDADRVYLMLHGDYFDSSRFWGEGTAGNREAVNLTNIPAPSGKVVFTGCCWGALTVDQPAVRALPNVVPAQKSPGASMALTFLQNGTTAFVGCTGAHYSPTDEPYDYFGGPMHAAFWQRLRAAPPAKALFEAKVDYVRGFPHGRDTPLQQAIEYKILRQYTCLGLGW
jgi:beta-lactamase superfamily II metal-dependent hydrolase